mmetsp:Transcript_71700/g.134094  ORF Transcript_71700/g.134094 Transcript_71700/m.134094 type:complete len:105 (+) Transcript_71700:62-376(+)
MARSSQLLRSLCLAVVAWCGFHCAFVPAPGAATRLTEGHLVSAATSSGAMILAAAPALAEELPPDEIYNRKVLEAASYCLIFSAFLVGLVIFQARKLVENKWLN